MIVVFFPIVQMYPLLAIIGAGVFFAISSIETWYMSSLNSDTSEETECPLSEQVCCNTFVNEAQNTYNSNYWQNTIINFLSAASMGFMYFKYRNVSPYIPNIHS